MGNKDYNPDKGFAFVGKTLLKNFMYATDWKLYFKAMSKINGGVFRGPSLKDSLNRLSSPKDLNGRLF